MPAHCSLCRDEDELPGRQWLRHISELLAASDQVISSPADLRGLSTSILTDMLLNVRVGSISTFFDPTMRSAERTQTVRGCARGGILIKRQKADLVVQAGILIFGGLLHCCWFDCGRNTSCVPVRGNRLRCLPWFPMASVSGHPV
jgi:hypothetical protein